jgi:hypothetical protein
MGASLVVDIHHHSSELSYLVNEFAWVDNHEVYVQLLFAEFGYCFKHRESETDVWHEHAIHYVEVEPFGAAAVDHLNFAFQISEICRKE